MRIILLFFTALLYGCNADYDGKYIVDSQDNVYVLEHRLGHLYYVEKIDDKHIYEHLNKIKSLRKNKDEKDIAGFIKPIEKK